MPLTIQKPDMRLLFLRGAFRFRPWYDEPFVPCEGQCHCGREGTHKVGSDWECDRCKVDNSKVVHLCDKPKRLTDDEWQESRERKLEWYRAYNRTRRKKVNQMLDSKPEDWQTQDEDDCDC